MITPFMPPILDQPAAYPNAEWSAQSDKYVKWYKYFSGEVLSDVESNPDTVIEKYPIKINTCRPVVNLNAYSILGDWDNAPFSWKSMSGSNQDGIDFLDSVGRLSRINSNFIRQVYSYCVYGGMIWSIRKAPQLPTGVRWNVISPDSFFPVFSSLDDDLLEVFVTTQISGREAKLMWGVDVENETALYTEHWTKTRYDIWVDEKRVRGGGTPGGVIPYVYIPYPNIAGERYGVSVIDGITGLQDELNTRMADVGDAIHRETHKKMVVSNLPTGVKGIRVHGNIMDLGVGLGNATPEVHDYSLATVPTGSYEMMNRLVDFTRYTAQTPPIAYGEDEGSQRSGMTLVIRMWPLLQAAKSARGFIADYMSILADKTMRIGSHDGSALPSEFQPDFAPILPKDREQIVNEVVQLSGVNKISDERAVDLLGIPETDVDEEVGRIKELREAERQSMMKQPFGGGSINGNTGG